MKKTEKMICLSAIILLFALSATYCVRFYMLKKEFSEYRSRQFTRAYECLCAKLGEYRMTSDSGLSAQIATFLYMLPVSESEMRIAEKFCTDIANSGSDREAALRAGMYCEMLLRFLNEERGDNYEKGYLTAGLGMPAYNFEEMTVSAMPDENAVRQDMREDAEALLGTVRLTHTVIIDDGERLNMFRTSRSYAVYDEDGKLIRALIGEADPTGKVKPDTDGKGAEQTAADFLRRYGYENMKLISSERSPATHIMTYSDKRSGAAVGVSLNSGNVRFFEIVK